jgi:hypothetical protein
LCQCRVGERVRSHLGARPRKQRVSQNFQEVNQGPCYPMRLGLHPKSARPSIQLGHAWFSSVTTTFIFYKLIYFLRIFIVSFHLPSRYQSIPLIGTGVRSDGQAYPFFKDRCLPRVRCRLSYSARMARSLCEKGVNSTRNYGPSSPTPFFKIIWYNIEDHNACT